MTSWQTLRQLKGQSVQGYTQEFRKRALILGISLDSPETLLKYIGGLHSYMRHIILMFNPTSIDEVSVQATHLEARGKNGSPQVGGSSQPTASKNKQKWKARKAKTTQKSKASCTHCKKDGHDDEHCWILHLELRPKKFESKKKKTVVAIQKYLGLDSGDETTVAAIGIREYDILFQEPKGLPPKKEIVHDIILQQDAPLPNIEMYRLSTLENTKIKKQVQELLEKRFIRPSTSPCGSPIFLVRKKDGSWRMCIGYQALNKITIKNHCPLPRIDDLLDQLKDVVYFSKLDLHSGYHQVRVAEQDAWKNAFKTKQGLYEWLVMPFGLTNAPTTFMRLMNDVLRPCLADFVIVYLDDILIFSKTWEKHLKHVKQTLDVLKREKLYVKLSKCEFGKTSLNYLGHIIGGGELKMDPSKVAVIVNCPKPKSATEVRSFLVASQYWRKFIANFSLIAAPLHALIGLNKVFQWGGK
eukprot:PITA_30329